MNFAPIAPLSLVNMVAPTSKYLMALPAMMDDKDYKRLYKRLRLLGAYVMLDNGLSENKEPLTAEELEALTVLILPSEVVLPDFLTDSARTIRASRATLEYLLFDGGYAGRFMAVAQGNTLREYMDCIYELLSIRDVHCIGLSKYFPEITGISRRALLNSIASERLHHRKIEWHLLGVCEPIDEVAAIALEFPWLRGIDTCYPVLAAMKGIDIEIKTQLVATSPKGFFYAKTHKYWPADLPLPPMYDLLHRNLKAFDNACHGRAP